MSGIEFRQELVAQGAVPAFQLALAFRRVGAAINQMNAQSGTNTLQCGGAVGRAIVDHQLLWQTAFKYRLLENALDIQCRFAEAECAVRNQAGRIIHQRPDTLYASR